MFIRSITLSIYLHLQKWHPFVLQSQVRTINPNTISIGTNVCILKYNSCYNSVVGDPPWYKKEQGNTQCYLGMEMTN